MQFNVYGQTQVSLQQQQLLYNGKEMRNSEKLGALGVTDGDLVMMVPNTASSGSRFLLKTRSSILHTRRTPEVSIFMAFRVTV